MSVATHFVIPGRRGDEQYVIGTPTLTVIVESWHGREVKGGLVDFQPTGKFLKLIAAGQQRSVTVEFGKIKRLQILHQGSGAPRSSFHAVSDDILSPFVVHLRDDSVYAGLCYACQQRVEGVWLFLRALDATEAERVFVPAEAYTRVEWSGVDAGAASLAEAAILNKFAEVALDDRELSADTVPATETRIDSVDALKTALERQSRLKPIPIGEALLGLGKVTPDQLRQTLEQQARNPGEPLGQMLLKIGLIDVADLQLALARKMGYPFVDVYRFPIDGAAVKMVPYALASRLTCLPLALLDQALVVALPDPLNFRVIDELEFTAQRKIIPVVGLAHEIERRIPEVYRALGAGEEVVLAAAPAPSVVLSGAGEESWQLAAELEGQRADGPIVSDEKVAEQSDNTLVRLVNSIITEAFHQRASDIHIEPYPGNEKIVVRFRIDGELRPYLELPASYRNALVARIKVMCDLDISERRKPQDGKIQFRRFGGLPIELRVATIPIANGLEDVVMRILSSSEALPLSELHLSPRNLREVEAALDRPYGLFLCVGPTGSGKTTTLHAALKRLNTPNRKVWTAEDPVEITQRGLRQIQVNPKIGWTFAHALRALLRADPDVIMVGEIRDAETAEMAIEASLTGHLVMSTLHTNSAAETILRLRDLGVDPFSFADSLQAILAQRLARRLCAACKRDVPLQDAQLEELMRDYQKQLPDHHPLRDDRTLVAEWRERFGKDGVLYIAEAPGCRECGHTGFRGRLALHELLVTSNGMRHLIQVGSPPAELMAQAISDGMRTLRQDGIEKVLQGLTSLTEVRAVSNA